MPRIFRRPWLPIVFVAALAHGLVLLNDGVYWDGWLILTRLERGRWDLLWAHFAESGLPQVAYLHWVMRCFPDVITGYKLVSFASIAMSGILVYSVGRTSNLISSTESLFIAMLAVSYPAFQVSMELIVLPYLLCYCLFLFGVQLALLSVRAAPSRRLALRIGSLVVFFLSFTANSLLVFYYGFLLLLLVYVHRTREARAPGSQVRLLLGSFDFVVLPVIFWLAKEALYPRHGLYANYNQFRLSADIVMPAVAGFLTDGIWGQIVGALSRLLRSPLLSLSTLAIGLAAAVMVPAGEPSYTRGTDAPCCPVRTLAVFGFGILLLGLGMLPYVITGHAPGLRGWTTRHALLLGLPIGVIVTSLFSFLLRRPGRWQSGFARGALAALVMAFCFSMIASYGEWQGRWVKDRSLILNLRRLDSARAYSVFWIDDQFLLGGEPYRFYEWSSIFLRTWGDESRIGLDAAGASPEFLTTGRAYFTSRYNLSHFDPAGRQVLLTIRSGAAASSGLELAIRYLYLKHFQPRSLEAFVASATSLQLRPSR